MAKKSSGTRAKRKAVSKTARKVAAGRGPAKRRKTANRKTTKRKTTKRKIPTPKTATRKTAAREAAKRNAARKSARAPRPARNAAGAPRPPAARERTVARRATFAATADCLDRPDAEVLVMTCAGGEFDIDTQLRDLFPSPNTREVFCQCVADSSGYPRPRIPCGGSTTLDQVIAAISC